MYFFTRHATLGACMCMETMGAFVQPSPCEPVKGFALVFETYYSIIFSPEHVFDVNAHSVVGVVPSTRRLRQLSKKGLLQKGGAAFASGSGRLCFLFSGWLLFWWVLLCPYTSMPLLQDGIASTSFGTSSMAREAV